MMNEAYRALKRIKCPVRKTESGFYIKGEPNSQWADCETLDVNPKIEKLLLKHNLYSDWNNNGDLEVYLD